MYPACTEGVQISGGSAWRRFCTFAPVDMHGFVHTRFARKGAQLQLEPLAGRKTMGWPANHGEPAVWCRI